MHGLLTTGDKIEMSVATLNMTKGAPLPGLSPVFEVFPATTMQLSDPLAQGGLTTVTTVTTTATTAQPGALPKVMPGVNANAARNFVWLPYHPGSLTLMPFGNLPVFTGWMSGCWIALVTIAGRTYVLHVGTDTAPTTPNTINVKNAIKIAIGTKAVTMIKAWQPTSNASQTMACVSPTRSFHDYGMQTTPNPLPGPMGLKVMGINTIVGKAGLPQGY